MRGNPGTDEATVEGTSPYCMKEKHARQGCSQSEILHGMYWLHELRPKDSGRIKLPALEDAHTSFHCGLKSREANRVGSEKRK